MPLSSWIILTEHSVSPPNGFKLLKSCPSQEVIDNASLVNCHILFRFSEVEWAEAVLEEIVPLCNRTKTKPFQYVMKWTDSTMENLMVWLDEKNIP